MKLRKEFKNVICFLLIISFIISQIPSSVYAFNLRNSNKNEYNSLNALNDGDILESEGTYRVSDTYIIPSIIKKALNSYSSNYDDDYDYYDYLGGALGISGLKENSHIYNNLKNIYGLIKNKDTFVGDFLHICYLNSNKDIYITEKDENGYFNITLDKTDSNFFVDSIKIDYETYTDSENNIIYGLKLTLDEIKKDAQFKNEIKIGDTFNGGDTVYYIWAEGTNSKIAKFDGFAGMFKTNPIYEFNNYSVKSNITSKNYRSYGENSFVFFRNNSTNYDKYTDYTNIEYRNYNWDYTDEYVCTISSALSTFLGSASNYYSGYQLLTFPILSNGYKWQYVGCKTTEYSYDGTPNNIVLDFEIVKDENENSINYVDIVTGEIVNIQIMKDNNYVEYINDNYIAWLEYDGYYSIYDTSKSINTDKTLYGIPKNINANFYDASTNIKLDVGYLTLDETTFDIENFDINSIIYNITRPTSITKDNYPILYFSIYETYLNDTKYLTNIMNSEYELLDVYCIPSKTNVYFRNGVTNKLLEVIEVSLIEKDEYNGLKDIIYPLNITDELMNKYKFMMITKKDSYDSFLERLNVSIYNLELNNHVIPFTIYCGNYTSGDASCTIAGNGTYTISMFTYSGYIYKDIILDYYKQNNSWYYSSKYNYQNFETLYNSYGYNIDNANIYAHTYSYDYGEIYFDKISAFSDFADENGDYVNLYVRSYRDSDNFAIIPSSDSIIIKNGNNVNVFTTVDDYNNYIENTFYINSNNLISLDYTPRKYYNSMRFYAFAIVGQNNKVNFEDTIYSSENYKNSPITIMNTSSEYIENIPYTKKDVSKPLGHIWSNSEENWIPIDNNDINSYSFITNINNNVIDLDTLILYAENGSEIDMSLLEIDSNILYGTLCSRAEDAYKLKIAHTHNYGDPIFNWEDDYSSCTATFNCTSVDDTQILPCVITFEKVEPTYEKEGKITYIATVEFNNKTYTDTKEVSIPKLIDNTNPNLTINISTNSWKEFLNNISFNLFFNDIQDVEILAEDLNPSIDSLEVASGVKSISYYVSSNKLTLDELKELTNWNNYDSEDKFSLSPNGEYIVYAKAEDNVGNIGYASSDGIIFDNIAPIFDGIENGKTYSDSKLNITVKDTYLSSLNIDGAIEYIDGFKEFTFSLNNDSTIENNTTHTLIAKDKAGNITKITFDLMTKPEEPHKCIKGEKQIENIKEATCTKKGSYDEVYYCIECKAELSRETFETNMLGHIWNENDWILIDNLIITNDYINNAHNKDELDFTNFDESKDSVYIRYCSRAKDTYELKIVIDSHIHTPDNGNIENVVNAKCTIDGGYDIVVRCSNCKEVLDTKHVILPKLGHTWNENDWIMVPINDVTETLIENAKNGSIINLDIIDSNDTIYKRFCSRAKDTYELKVVHTHNYGDPIFNWEDDYSSCTATFNCTSIDDTQILPCIITFEKVEPTYEKEGKITYIATVEFNNKTYTDTKEVSIPKLVKPTDTPTSTPTDTPTSTPTDTPTSTPTDTPTSTPTDTPTSTPTDTPTSTPTDTPTSTPTDTPTSTPTDTPTSTPTDTPTSTPTDTPIENNINDTVQTGDNSPISIFILLMFTSILGMFIVFYISKKNKK